MGKGRCLVSVVLLIAAFQVAAGTVAAGHGPSCESVTEAWDAPVYVYAGPGGVEVWEEANGVDGLQRQGCVDETDTFVGPDTQVTELPPGMTLA